MLRPLLRDDFFSYRIGIGIGCAQVSHKSKLKKRLEQLNKVVPCRLHAHACTAAPTQQQILIYHFIMNNQMKLQILDSHPELAMKFYSQAAEELKGRLTIV